MPLLQIARGLESEMMIGGWIQQEQPYESEITSGTTTRSGGLRRIALSVRNRESEGYRHSRPAFVARRFRESSLSPIARTAPLSAKVVEVESARPSASTSTTLIWTEAWSLEVMRRSRWRGCSALSRTPFQDFLALTGRRALAGDVKVNEDTLKRDANRSVFLRDVSEQHAYTPDRSPWLESGLLVRRGGGGRLRRYTESVRLETVQLQVSVWPSLVACRNGRALGGPRGT